MISCGPAGEHLSRVACIHTETGNAAGQGGYGGVMGAKQLKAVAVRLVLPLYALLALLCWSQGGWLLANRARWLAGQGPGAPGRYVRVYERRPGRSRQLPDHVIGDLDRAEPLLEKAYDRIASLPAPTLELEIEEHRIDTRLLLRRQLQLEP